MRKLIVVAVAAIALAVSCCNQEKQSVLKYGGNSPIYPDYIDVTVPATIAPLDFSYMVPVRGKAVTRFSAGDLSFSCRGRKVRIDAAKWRRLLEAAKGSDIVVESTVLDTAWRIHVSADEIDYGLNYRLIEPSYEIYSKMGIYERNLSNYDQTPLIENTEFFGCCNCHSHCKGDPSTISMHIRGPHSCTLIMKDGQLEAYNTKSDSTLSFCVYTYWHPSGDYIAYSTNKSNQGFHAKDSKVLEVIDKDCDALVYDIRKGELIVSPLLAQERFGESFPSFSPDGRTMYFTRFDRFADPSLTNIMYTLHKVSFDPDNGTIGTDLQTVLDLRGVHKSVCFPKPSPDGRYIMYVRSDYGIFSSWHHESDLWLLNLETGEDRPIDEVNSSDSEGCHCWSTNGRWFVFGSRRDDGLFTRAYIAHFDPEAGRCGKAFMLPQRDPEKYYSELFFSYNIPEFVTGPKQFDNIAACNEINSEQRTDFHVRICGDPMQYRFTNPDAARRIDAASGASRRTDASSGASRPADANSGASVNTDGLATSGE